MDQIGRYEILNELGRGAMGVVYRARDTKIGREVAIKTIRLAEQADESETNKLRERLFREAQSAGRLSHPGIVTIYDVAEEAGLAYITMEFVEGETLQDIMDAGRAKDPAFIADVLRQTAAALDYAHSREIVHRDIKPANIMVTADGTVKITDFGIARISSSKLTQTGTVMGTPSYMSPEQVRGDPIDGASDQFSLGVITYELLTGKKPFAGDSLTAVMFKIVSGDVVPPSELMEGLAPELEEAILKSLAKSGQDRFPSCTEFAAAMASGLESSEKLFSARDEREDSTTADGLPTVVQPPEQPSDGAGEEAQQLETVVRPSPPEDTAPTIALPDLPSFEEREEAVAEEEPEERRKTGLWIAVAAVAGLAVAGGGYWLSQNQFFDRTAETTPVQSQAAESGTSEAAGGIAAPPESASEPASAEDSQASDSPPEQGGAGETEVASASPPKVEPPRSTPPPEPKAAPAPPPKKPAPPKEVAVNFSTPQAGARVVVDGKPQWSCTTPCSLELPRGEHTALISLSGFHRVRKTFNLKSEPLDLAFDMEAVVGTLLLSSSPQGAAIYVDGKKMEEKTNTSLRLPPGHHIIKAEKAGAGSASQSVRVEENGLKAVQFVLSSKPPRSKLVVKTSPPGAQIILNDSQRLGATPRELDLAPGSYRLSLSLAGHRPVIKEFQLPANETVTIDEKLSSRN